jgi:ketosteroid isomerase-like protein
MGIDTHDQQLNALIEAGRPMEAFERFYAEDVIMQENETTPRVGKAANRAACQAFVDQSTDLRMRLVAAASAGDVSFAEWAFTYRGPDGREIRHSEVAVRRWADGRIVSERFYYGGDAAG